MAEIKRILVANRGEIALRAIRTIKEMGKEAVAVYSTADKDASYLKACRCGNLYRRGSKLTKLPEYPCNYRCM
jgi:acetyl/propionyl-CoA carboxylase alpha subunit